MAKKKRKLAMAISLLAASCVSVPRDGGLSQVQQTVVERGAPPVEWRSGAADRQHIDDLLAAELTADRAVEIAVANNPRLQVTLAELGVARADLLDASTVSNPLLELEWRFPARPYNPFEVRIAQSILDLARLPRRRAAGRAAFDAAKSRVAGEVLSFAAGVRDDYYALVAATERLEASRAALHAAGLSAELSARQQAAGNADALEVEQQQAVLDQATLLVARDEEDVAARREALVRALGLSAVPAWKMASALPPIPAVDPTAEDLSAVLAKRRIDLLVARRELDALTTLLPATRLGAMGEIVVDVHHERDAGGEATTGPGIELPIPLFNRGTAARARATAQLSAATQRLASLELSAASEVRAARERLAAARKRAEYFRDVVVPRQTRIVELTRVRQNAMLVGAFQLLQARQNENLAEREAVDARLSYWLARNDLDRAINGVAGRSTVSTEAAAGPSFTSPQEGH